MGYFVGTAGTILFWKESEIVAKSSPRLLSDSVEALTRDVAAEANTSILLLLLITLPLHVLPQIPFPLSSSPLSNFPSIRLLWSMIR